MSACQASSADDCRLSQEAFCLDLVPDDGFVADRANQCIDAVRSAYADARLTKDELATVVRLDEPCDRLVRGLQSANETCSTDLDCDAPAGFECVIKGSATTGSCQTPVVVQPGLDCSSESAVCTEGFYCNGQDCVGGGAMGESCVRNEECSDGYCNAGTCSATLAINTACTLDAQCASGVCYRFSATEQVCIDNVVLSRTDPICDDLR